MKFLTNLLSNLSHKIPIDFIKKIKKEIIIATLTLVSWAAVVALAPQDASGLLRWFNGGRGWNLGSFPFAGSGHHTYQLSPIEMVEKIELKQFVINGAVLSDADVVIQGTDSAKLYVENLIINGLSAKKFEIKNSDIINFSAQKVRADGISFKQTPKEVEVFDLISRDTKATVSEKGFSVDKVKLTGSGDTGVIENLTIKDFQVKDTVTLQYLTVRNLTLKNVRVGSGDGLATKDLVASNFSIKNEVGLDVQEELIEIK